MLYPRSERLNPGRSAAGQRGRQSPFGEQLGGVASARRARLRRAGAACAGVVRRPVVRIARGGMRDRVRRVILPHARRAKWFRAGVVRSCGRQHGTASQRAEHAPAADRFAREIVRILTASAARSRRLMGIPLGGTLLTPSPVTYNSISTRRLSSTFRNVAAETVPHGRDPKRSFAIDRSASHKI